MEKARRAGLVAEVIRSEVVSGNASTAEGQGPADRALRGTIRAYLTFGIKVARHRNAPRGLVVQDSKVDGAARKAASSSGTAEAVVRARLAAQS